MAKKFPHCKVQVRAAVFRGLIPANRHGWNSQDFLITADLMGENDYRDAEAYFRHLAGVLGREEKEERDGILALERGEVLKYGEAYRRLAEKEDPWHDPDSGALWYQMSTRERLRFRREFHQPISSEQGEAVTEVEG